MVTDDGISRAHEFFEELHRVSEDRSVAWEPRYLCKVYDTVLHVMFTKAGGSHARRMSFANFVRRQLSDPLRLWEARLKENESLLDAMHNLLAIAFAETSDGITAADIAGRQLRRHAPQPGSVPPGQESRLHQFFAHLAAYRSAVVRDNSELATGHLHECWGLATGGAVADSSQSRFWYEPPPRPPGGDGARPPSGSWWTDGETRTVVLMYLELEFAEYWLRSYQRSQNFNEKRLATVHLKRASNIQHSSSNEIVSALNLRLVALRHLSAIHIGDLRRNATRDYLILPEERLYQIVQESHRIVSKPLLKSPMLSPLYHLFTLKDLLALYDERPAGAEAPVEVLHRLLQWLGRVLDGTAGREEANVFVVKLLKKVISRTADESTGTEPACDMIGRWCLEYLEKAKTADEMTIGDVLVLHDQLTSDDRARTRLPRTWEALSTWKGLAGVGWAVGGKGGDDGPEV